MKRLHIIAIAFLSLTAATCGGEKTLVKEAAYGYLDAMGNYRIADARPYATPQTQKATLDYLESIMTFANAEDIQKNTPAKITIKSIKMLSDTVAHAYYRKVTPIKTQNDSITLVKRNGEWKVNLIIQRSRTLDAMSKIGGADKANRPDKSNNQEKK